MPDQVTPRMAYVVPRSYVIAVDMTAGAFAAPVETAEVPASEVK
jgi:hypothetical protein